MKRVLTIALAAALLFSLCGCDSTIGKHQYSFFDVFDTVTELTVYAKSETAATECALKVHERLIYLNKLFDIYNEYDDAVSLMEVNRTAASAPVSVPNETIELIKLAKEAYSLTDTSVNAAMGSVLSIWHDYRQAGLDDPENAALPPMEELIEAAEHTDMDSVIIDEENGTVFFTDKLTRLDVGAIAKGFAGQLIIEELSDLYEGGEVSAALLSLGGNVCTFGTKPNGEAWQIAVQDPFSSSTLGTVDVQGGTHVVTSGDYQRYYTVDGVRYNHIIDPKTLMSATNFAAVTVICDSGGLADALSTALFIMDEEHGLALIDSIDGAEALWVRLDGSTAHTDGFNMQL